MKKLVFVIATLALSVSVFAADAVQPPKRRGPRNPKGPRQGGIVEKPYVGKVFRILNTQSDIAADKLAQITKDIRYAALLPIECVQGTLSAGECPFKAADALVATDGVGAGAVIVSDPKLPIELVSPDRKWGILNIAPLKADNPSLETFDARFMKVYWGIVARTLGAGTSSYPGCVIVPFSDMKGLDAIKATRPCPEPYNKMIDTANAYGIKIITITSYRTACQQGWAPPPKDDVQKKIWEEVNALPKNPMTIEFDPKKGR